MLVSHSELLHILREWESRYWNVEVAESRREEDRYKVRWPVRVAVIRKTASSTIEFDEAYAVNISPSGLGVITRYPLVGGDWCLCLLTPSAASAPCILLGEVVWQRPVNEVFVTGLAFLAWQDDQEFDTALDTARRDRYAIA